MSNGPDPIEVSLFPIVGAIDSVKADAARLSGVNPQELESLMEFLDGLRQQLIVRCSEYAPSFMTDLSGGPGQSA